MITSNLSGRNFSVALSGDLGSGKSSVAKLLAEQLNIPYQSTGDLHRAIADERQLSTLELNRVAESDQSIDEQVDARLKQLAAENARVVIDSRMAWWFIPYALRVHLTVLPSVGAQRVMMRGGQAVEAYTSEDEARAKLRSRANSERSRFMNLYGVDPHRLRNYDLVVDTTYLTSAEVTRRIIDELPNFNPERRHEAKGPRVALSPRALFPTQPIRELSSTTSLESVIIGYAYPSFFIINGHNRTAKALEQHTGVIEAELHAEGAEEVVAGIGAQDYFIDSVNWSRIHDWNAVFGTDLTLPV